MKSVKKFLKLLCFAFIAIFAVVLGGETVNAVEAPDNITVTRKNGTDDIFNIKEGWPFYVKYTSIGGQEYYAFCLDSSFNLPDQSIEKDDTLYSSNRKNVELIVSKAYNFGLGNGQSSHTISIDGHNYAISEKDLYGLTQMAVWNAVHGKDDTNGYTETYQEWVETDSTRNAIFDALTTYDKDDLVSGNYYVNLIPQGNSSLFTEDGETISSVVYKVKVSSNVPSGTSFTLSRTSGNGKICVNGTCSDSSSVTVHAEDNVVFKFDKPASGENVSSDFSIVSDEFSTGYSASFYNAGGNKKQNIGVVIPQFTVIQSSTGVSTTYVDSTEVRVQKVDSNGNAIAGAKLGIYRKSDNFRIQTVTSTNDATGVGVTLTVGEYYLKEIEAPNGYKLSDTKAYFNVVKDGNNVTVENVDSEGHSITSVAVISIQDDLKKVRFRKVDDLGNPMAGIRIDIGDYSQFLFNSAGDTSGISDIIACTVTDSNGYLKLCDNTTSDLYLGDGWFKVPADKVLYINEQLDQNENKLTGFYTNLYDKGMQMYFSKDGSDVVVINPNIQYNENNGDFEFTIKNIRYIDISKTEVKSSSEVPGALLSIYDAENLNEFLLNELRYGNPNVVLNGLDQYVFLDSWESETTPHKFVGIVPNHRYILVENLAPEGYIKIGSIVEFSMNAQGVVSVHSGSEFTNTSSYKLGISNDYTKIFVSKTSFVTGEEVEGAHLKICTKESYDLSGNDCQTKSEWQWVSETTPHPIEKLPVGEYYLVETIAPAGYYQATNAVLFSVSDSVGKTIKFENKPTKVVIKKLDNVTKEMIEGAQFKILKASDRSEVLDKDGKPLEWTSTKDEPWVIYALPAGEYILVETKVPEGYQEGMIVNGEVVNEYKFTVSDDVENIDVEVYIEVLNAPSTGVSTLNLFAIGALLIFTGYETIKIYRRKVNA